MHSGSNPLPDRRLWLIRHAKSDWTDGVPDFERGLNGRGRRDGPVMAQWLRSQPCKAQWIWSSTATRAMATAAFVASGFELDANHVIGIDALYLASPEVAMDVLRGTPADITGVALVFHNPGITTLVNLLAGRPVSDNLPTFGIAEFTTTVDWKHAGTHTFRFEQIVTPRGVRPS